MIRYREGVFFHHAAVLQEEAVVDTCQRVKASFFITLRLVLQYYGYVQVIKLLIYFEVTGVGPVFIRSGQLVAVASATITQTSCNLPSRSHSYQHVYANVIPENWSFGFVVQLFKRLQITLQVPITKGRTDSETHLYLLRDQSERQKATTEGERKNFHRIEAH